MTYKTFQIKHSADDLKLNVRKIDETYSQYNATVFFDSKKSKFSVVAEGSISLINNIPYITESGFYSFGSKGNINFEFSYSGAELLFQPGDVYIFTITSGTNHFLGCKGFIKHKIAADGTRIITFKIKK